MMGTIKDAMLGRAFFTRLQQDHETLGCGARGSKGLLVDVQAGEMALLWWKGREAHHGADRAVCGQRLGEARRHKEKGQRPQPATQLSNASSRGGAVIRNSVK